MLNEQTHQKLVQMRLYAMAEAFAEYLDAPKNDGLSFTARFALFVDRQFVERKQKRLQRRLKTAKLREQACLADVDYRHPRGLDREVVEQLATCNWIRQHQNLILTGATGVGKTWLACAVSHRACMEGFSAKYLRVPRLLHDLGIARADGSYAKTLEKLARVQLLILDDWGLTTLGAQQRRDILEILEDRYQRRSTILTSQLPVKKWHEYIGEPTLADAILDRVVHSAHRIDLHGPSMRKHMKSNNNPEGT